MGKIVKEITVALLILLCTGSVSAVPARRTKITVRQSDGTELVVSQRGDEHFHYYVTDDGLPLLRDANGDFCHAIIEDGKIVSSAILAHDISRRTEQERAFIASRGDISGSMSRICQAKVSSRNAARARRVQKARTNGKTAYEGNKRGLVILVNFKDVQFRIPSPKEHFLKKLNTHGYSEYNCHGSVSEYFSDQSNGKFNLTFDVAGPYTLSQNMVYYGGNDSNGNDKRPRKMVEEACRLAAKDDIDYAKYDWYGDGNVDLVFVVYAGYCESQCVSIPNPNTIWPHQWELKQKLTFNGKTVSTYACTGELAGEKGITPDGIGTFCHEFSHCLGLPDFYDTNGDAFGMNRWSLMDYGNYLGENECGGCPCNYTAYERWCCGWSEPKELTTAADINDMKSLDSGNAGYIIYNDAHRDEYYILDNRQREGWDSYLPGHGLMVTHVDYNENMWYYNTVNNDASHQRCTIIHADDTDGTKKILDLAGDPFPGETVKTELTDTSKPAATLFNDNANGTKFMGKSITDITESGTGLISFKFMGGIGDAINDVTINGSHPYDRIIPHNYRQMLPHGIRLKKHDGKTIKFIESK